MRYLPKFKAVLKSFGAMPWTTQLLLFLALATYLWAGLFLGLFANGFDFQAIHRAAIHIVNGSGGAIYQELFTTDFVHNPDVFGYPPVFAMLFSPLGFLPKQAAWIVFQLVSHGFLWGAVWLGMAEARERNPQTPAAFAWIGIALFSPIYYSLWAGQCETIILFLLLFMLRSIRRQMPLRASLALAVAIWLKCFLVFLLACFLFRRQVRFLLLVIGWILALWAASLLVVPAAAQYQYWSHLGIYRSLQAFYDNHAASGFAFRLFTVNPYTVGLVQAPRLALTVQWALVLFLVVRNSLSLIRKSIASSLEWAFSFTLVTNLLISPFTDSHHLALLLIPFLSYSFSPTSRPAWRWFYAFFAVSAPFVTFKFDDPVRWAFFAHGFHSLVFSMPFFGLLALWFYMSRTTSCSH